jgi:hypothetical protein
MLMKAKALKGYRLDSVDGEIGKVEEFYFDDHHWTVRYLVAETGNWLTSREVLISPHSMLEVDQEARHILVDLTKKEIEESPPLESHVPVSRQFEDAYYRYYGWPNYWDGPHAWGPYPRLVRNDLAARRDEPHVVRDRDVGRETSSQNGQDRNLRSTRDVTGYRIQASDGEIGHVEDFMIDDETWDIRYLIVDTRNWWPGKKVLVAVKCIERVSWPDSEVYVNLSRETIMQSQEYKKAPPAPIFESGLSRGNDKPGYWIDAPAGEKCFEAI